MPQAVERFLVDAGLPRGRSELGRRRLGNLPRGHGAPEGRHGGQLTIGLDLCDHAAVQVAERDAARAFLAPLDRLLTRLLLNRIAKL